MNHMQNFKTLSYVILASAIFLLSHDNIYAQQAPKISWQNWFGGSRADWAYSIIPAGGNFSGNYIIAGYTNSTDGIVSGHHAGGEPDAWVVSLDSFGLFWQNCFGGSGDDGAY